MAIAPDPEDAKKFDNHVYTTKSYIGMHSHSAYIKGTCHNGERGASGCRLNMPRDLLPRTKPVKLIDQSTYDEDTNKLKLRYSIHDNDKYTSLEPIRTRQQVIEKLIPRNRMDPLANPDTRLIVWEIKRPLLAPLAELPDSGSATKQLIISEIMNAITDVQFKKIDEEAYYRDYMFVEPQSQENSQLLLPSPSPLCSRTPQHSFVFSQSKLPCLQCSI